MQSSDVTSPHFQLCLYTTGHLDISSSCFGSSPSPSIPAQPTWTDLTRGWVWGAFHPHRAQCFFNLCWHLFRRIFQGASCVVHPCRLTTWPLNLYTVLYYTHNLFLLLLTFVYFRCLHYLNHQSTSNSPPPNTSIVLPIASGQSLAAWLGHCQRSPAP